MAALCDQGPLIDACVGGDGIDKIPETALFLLLRASFRTTNNSAGSIAVAPPIDPAAVTPLAVWALTKLVHYLNVRTMQPAPAWFLAHCTYESMYG